MGSERTNASRPHGAHFVVVVGADEFHGRRSSSSAGTVGGVIFGPDELQSCDVGHGEGGEAFCFILELTKQHNWVFVQGDTGGREKGFVHIKVRKFHLSIGLQGSYSNGLPSRRNTS